jgi:hypothetical protein
MVELDTDHEVLGLHTPPACFSIAQPLGFVELAGTRYEVGLARNGQPLVKHPTTGQYFFFSWTVMVSVVADAIAKSAH